MKKQEVNYRIKLGIFILIGTILLTALVLYIGSNRYFLWKGKDITSEFRNIHGLKEGSAVRYSGVHVGTVRQIEILSDSTVQIHMTIESEALKFIKSDSEASIGTEGLIGSKYVKISPGSPHLSSVKPGANLQSTEAVDIEELLATVSETSDKARDISMNLYQITSHIESGKGLLGAIIHDQTMEQQVRNTFHSFQETGRNSREFSDKMIDVAGSLEKTGEKAENISNEVYTASQNLVNSSVKLENTTGNIHDFSEKLNSDSSNLGRLINDTTLVWYLEEDLKKIGNTADEVKETSSRIRDAWILRLFSRKNKD